MGCKHKLKHLCNDKDLVDQYLWNLGSYCQYTAKRTVGKRGLDYKRQYDRVLKPARDLLIVEAYKMLLDACPEIETEFKHLEKRQSTFDCNQNSNPRVDINSKRRCSYRHFCSSSRHLNHSSSCGSIGRVKCPGSCELCCSHRINDIGFFRGCCTTFGMEQ